MKSPGKPIFAACALVLAATIAILLRHNVHHRDQGKAIPGQDTATVPRAPVALPVLSNNTKVSVEGTSAPSVHVEAVSQQLSSQEASNRNRFPSKMSEENGRRVAAMQKDLMLNNALYDDLLKLAKSEPADPNWSPQMESNFYDAFREHAGGYGGLELSDVRCTASICYMSATVASGTPSTATSADWQRLEGRVFSEPWFSESFMDINSIMGGDANGTIYISIYLRKK